MMYLSVMSLCQLQEWLRHERRDHEGGLGEAETWPLGKKTRWSSLVCWYYQDSFVNTLGKDLFLLVHIINILPGREWNA